MKIVLKKDHERNGVLYHEGEEIEVAKEEYDFINSCYLADKIKLKEQVEQLELEILPSKKGVK